MHLIQLKIFLYLNCKEDWRIFAMSTLMHISNEPYLVLRFWQAKRNILLLGTYPSILTRCDTQNLRKRKVRKVEKVITVS